MDELTLDDIDTLDRAALQSFVQAHRESLSALPAELLHRLRVRKDELDRQDAEREERERLDREAQWRAEREARELAKRRAKVPPELAAEYERVEAAHEYNYGAIHTRIDYLTIVNGRGTPGTNREDYIVLVSGDPYYQGMPSQKRAAEWVRVLWQRLGLKKALHIRGIHYATRGLGDVVTWEREKAESFVPYDGAHSDIAWGAMQEAIGAGRYLGVIPWDMILDKKNPEPKGYVAHVKPNAAVSVETVSTDLADKTATKTVGDTAFMLPMLPEPPDAPELPDIGTEPGKWRGRWGLAAAPKDADLAKYSIDRYSSAQRYYLEVWCEKSGPTETLLEWCRAHNAKLVTGEGEMTLTAAYQTVQRMVEDGRPTVILYVSDFDFVGNQMPVSIARKVQWQRDNWHIQYPKDHVPEAVVVRAALTVEQVKRFHLMDEPIKESQKFYLKDGKRLETARWVKWQEQYGADQGTVELDALEGTQVGRLAQVLDDAVAPFYDDHLYSTEHKAREQLKTKLTELRTDVLADHADINALARFAWEQTLADADRDLRETWTEATEALREPWEEAQRVLDEAWKAAWAILEPAWQKAHELTDEPLRDAELELNAAQSLANRSMREAWQELVAEAAAIEQELDEQMPDVESRHPDLPDDETEYAPPWGAEAPDDVLNAALFWSVRDYMEQVRLFKVYQGKEGAA